jgi:hypothetical protein
LSKITVVIAFAFSKRYPGLADFLHFTYLSPVFDYIALVKADTKCRINICRACHVAGIEMGIMAHAFIKTTQIRANLLTQVGYHGASIGGKSARPRFDMVASQGNPGGQHLRVESRIELA